MWMWVGVRGCWGMWGDGRMDGWLGGRIDGLVDGCRWMGVCVGRGVYTVCEPVVWWPGDQTEGLQWATRRFVSVT